MADASHLGDEVEPHGCRVVTAAGLDPDAPATKVMRGGLALEGGGRAASEPDDEMAVGNDATIVEDRDGATCSEAKDEDSSEERSEASTTPRLGPLPGCATGFSASSAQGSPLGEARGGARLRNVSMGDANL